MRVSIPTIPHTAKPIPNVTLPEAIKRLTDFLRGGATTVLTGAGVSVDSGIKAYRGQDGRYMNPNFQPIFYHELIDETDKGHRFRQRYWSICILILNFEAQYAQLCQGFARILATPQSKTQYRTYHIFP